MESGVSTLHESVTGHDRSWCYAENMYNSNEWYRSLLALGLRLKDTPTFTADTHHGSFKDISDAEADIFREHNVNVTTINGMALCMETAL